MLWGWMNETSPTSCATYMSLNGGDPISVHHSATLCCGVNYFASYTEVRLIVFARRCGASWRQSVGSTCCLCNTMFCVAGWAAIADCGYTFWYWDSRIDHVARRCTEQNWHLWSCESLQRSNVQLHPSDMRSDALWSFVRGSLIDAAAADHRPHSDRDVDVGWRIMRTSLSK